MDTSGQPEVRGGEGIGVQRRGEWGVGRKEGEREEKREEKTEATRRSHGGDTVQFTHYAKSLRYYLTR